MIILAAIFLREGVTQCNCKAIEQLMFYRIKPPR